jgi:hypothetical protein
VCASGGWGECKASATVRLVCSGWKCCHDDALVMRQLLRQDAADEGRASWCGAASSATAFNALTRTRRSYASSDKVVTAS